jgi:hypothetical protein
MADLRTPDQLRRYEDEPSQWHGELSEQWSEPRQVSPTWLFLGVSAAVLFGLAIFHLGRSSRA